ncbi:GFA family protein [Altererythrobacter sp. Root672]|uniref:GFA family protein n=1 Tax=Altererythrobacter sp. Root672 TaxID=1736584 RepID=UPI0006FB7327|nr:DUF6151 family protein [Altererythrobacter sp. Root672]KRA80565.1 hypothetical protein ASD76_15515 [Altererythrobacter sp. Root672]
MSEATQLQCLCGEARLEVRGEPIIVSECFCDSCRLAADRLAALPGALPILTALGGSPCAEYRKDRVRIMAGADHLAAFHLSPEAGTRRVVASCCHTPMFLEMPGAHWLSVYLHLWPYEMRPTVQVRTMTSDVDDPSDLPGDLPNLKTHAVSFYAKLFFAWVAMGFRSPKLVIERKIDA